MRATVLQDESDSEIRFRSGRYRTGLAVAVEEILGLVEVDDVAGGRAFVKAAGVSLRVLEGRWGISLQEC